MSWNMTSKMTVNWLACVNKRVTELFFFLKISILRSEMSVPAHVFRQETRNSIELNSKFLLYWILCIKPPHIRAVYISTIKSIRSISQKSKFYRRAVSKFIYTMCNQCGMFYTLRHEYELKILRVSLKLAYLGIYFTEKHARWRLMWLAVLLRLQHFSCVSYLRAERCKN